MKDIRITAQYPLVKVNSGDIAYQAEKKWIERPAWIKVTHNIQKPPRFLSIVVPKYGELIYKAFGNYYCPIDYTNDEERRFMDGMAADYDAMVADVFNVPMAKALLSQLPLGEIGKNAHVLDLGCGTGILTELLAQIGLSHFTLVDFSNGMLIQAKNKLAKIKTIDYERMDIAKKLPKGRFDAIVSVMLFNTFNAKMTDLILGRLSKKMTKNALFGVVEDAEKPAYAKYFNPIVNKVVDIGPRAKYIFVGRKK